MSDVDCDGGTIEDVKLDLVAKGSETFSRPL